MTEGSWTGPARSPRAVAVAGATVASEKGSVAQNTARTDSWVPRLVALDVDGTVVAAHSEVTPRVVEAVRQTVAAGATVVLATGRSVDELGLVVDALGLSSGYSICSNGAVLARYMPEVEIDEVTTFDAREAVGLLRQRLPSAIVAVEVPGFGYHVTDVFPVGEIHGQQQITDWADLHLTDVTRVIFRDPAATADDFVALARTLDFAGLSLSVGYKAWLDIGPCGTSKGSALAGIARRLGVRSSHVLAIGDGRNDVEMLAWAGRGVAMGNAPLDVQLLADDVTSAVEQDGLAVELERWFGATGIQSSSDASTE
jgi:Cof subfamily protein (haloacid dehalogenase superfamily)